MFSYEFPLTAGRAHLETGDKVKLRHPGISNNYLSFEASLLREEAGTSSPKVLTDAEAVEAVAEFTALLGILSEGLTAISRTARHLSTYFAAAQAA